MKNKTTVSLQYSVNNNNKKIKQNILTSMLLNAYYMRFRVKSKGFYLLYFLLIRLQSY